MIDNYTAIGILLGMLGIGAHFGLYFHRKRNSSTGTSVVQPNLSDGAMIFFSGAGISAGIKVCIFSVNANTLLSTEIERTYIFFGGLALIWVSVDTIRQLMSK